MKMISNEAAGKIFTWDLICKGVNGIIMKLSDIDLSHIKMAIFDFYDTFAIHKYRDFMKKHFEAGEESKNNYYFNAYKDPAGFYEKIEPCERSEVLYRLILILRERGIKLYCLSGMKFSFHLKAKQAFLDKHYGKGIEVISAASQEHKLQGVRVLQKTVNCRADEVLFVDDRKTVIELLRAGGVTGLLADEIVL